jgi:hypothetical protein
MGSVRLVHWAVIFSHLEQNELEAPLMDLPEILAKCIEEQLVAQDSESYN